MKTVPDSRFGERPHYEPGELDQDCEDLIIEFLRGLHGNVRFPVETETLKKLIERDAADLDCYADLTEFGEEVEGLTEFRPGKKPNVLISKRLTEDERYENRLRTTLTHEYGHVRFHAYLFDLQHRQGQLFQGSSPQRLISKRDNIMGAPATDWMEWQAGYVCGAILMPVSSVRRLVRTFRETERSLGGVITADTMFNPFLRGLDASIDLALSKNLEWALERLYGLPTKRSQQAFPRFSDWHIVKRDRVPPLKQMTCYQFTDPHGERNWFTQWWGRDAAGNRWLYREWPDITCGEWALPGGDAHPGGKEGPAQRYEGGKSFNDYKRLFYVLEGWDVLPDGTLTSKGRDVEEIFDRRMDPRPAATSVPSDEYRETYVDHMLKPIVAPDGKELAPGMEFGAAPSCGVQEGMGYIADALSEGYDPEKPVDPLNCPKTYISAECQNTIYALRTCPAVLREKDAVKDPIDCCKGALAHGIPYVEPSGMKGYGGGSY